MIQPDSPNSVCHLPSLTTLQPGVFFLLLDLTRVCLTGDLGTCCPLKAFPQGLPLLVPSFLQTLLREAQLHLCHLPSFTAALWSLACLPLSSVTTRLPTRPSSIGTGTKPVVRARAPAAAGAWCTGDTQATGNGRIFSPPQAEQEGPGGWPFAKSGPRSLRPTRTITSPAEDAWSDPFWSLGVAQGW